MKKPVFEDLLRNVGFRATPARVKLLEILWSEEKPLAVNALERKLKGAMNEVTIYRALEALADKGIIRRVDLGHAHAHYEFERVHHHHLVCTGCGKIEDTDICPLPAVSRSKQFKTIYSHNVEFFGVCKQCA